MANEAIKSARDTAAYLDRSAERMYELGNRIRLVNANDHKIMGSDGFTGFVSGIIPQDHDLETMFLDSFLRLANLEGGDTIPVVDTLEKASKRYNMNFTLSVSVDAADFPENAKRDAVIAL